LVAGGSETDFERWEYRDWPELVEIRFSLPGVAIRIEGWDLDADEVLGFAGRLQRLELGSELLKSMRVQPPRPHRLGRGGSKSAIPTSVN